MRVYHLIWLLMFDYRSLSPKSRDGRMKKEKNIKAEEEEEETKKKEKVKKIVSLYWLPSVVSCLCFTV